MSESQSPSSGRIVSAIIVASIFAMAVNLIEHTVHLGRYGLELPLLAFIVGFLVSGAIGEEARRGLQRLPWVFVDASLILLGFSAGFNRLAAYGGKAGIVAIVNVAAGLTIGMIVALRLGLDERFAATFVAGGTICGITAAIAAGRAVRAEYPHLLIALLLIAVIGAPFAVAMSFAAHSLGKVGGALVGGVVDSTPVVRAIAAALPKDVGNIAVAIKFAQNALIAIAAIALAIVVSRIGGVEPVIPLALVLMLAAEIVSPFLGLSPHTVNAIENARRFLLGLAMVLAGMATPPAALKKPGVRLAIATFVIIEIVNIIVAGGLGALLFR